MPSFADPRMRALDAANRTAQELLDKGDYGNALKAFTEVKEQAQRIGLDASWPCWGLAICQDNLGDLEMAFASMVDSLRVDPLNLGKQGTYDAIVQHIRFGLATPERADDDPSTPRLYALLLQAGEADVGAHVAMARHLAAAGDVAGALGIVDAVTRLHPASRAGWELRAALARTAGDLEAARRCEMEAAACPAVNAPFGIPTPKAIC